MHAGGGSGGGGGSLGGHPYNTGMGHGPAGGGGGGGQCGDCSGHAREGDDNAIVAQWQDYQVIVRSSTHPLISHIILSHIPHHDTRAYPKY